MPAPASAHDSPVVGAAPGQAAVFAASTFPWHCHVCMPLAMRHRQNPVPYVQVTLPRQAAPCVGGLIGQVLGPSVATTSRATSSAASALTVPPSPASGAAASTPPAAPLLPEAPPLPAAAPPLPAAPPTPPAAPPFPAVPARPPPPPLPALPLLPVVVPPEPAEPPVPEPDMPAAPAGLVP